MRVLFIVDSSGEVEELFEGTLYLAGHELDVAIRTLRAQIIDAFMGT